MLELEVQSWVSSVKSSGLSTHPWGGGGCAQCDGVGSYISNLYCLGSISKKDQDPVAGGGVKSEQVQLADQLLGNDGVEC